MDEQIQDIAVGNEVYDDRRDVQMGGDDAEVRNAGLDSGTATKGEIPGVVHDSTQHTLSRTGHSRVGMVPAAAGGRGGQKGREIHGDGSRIAPERRRGRRGGRRPCKGDGG